MRPLSSSLVGCTSGSRITCRVCPLMRTQPWEKGGLRLSGPPVLSADSGPMCARSRFFAMGVGEPYPVLTAMGIVLLLGGSAYVIKGGLFVKPTVV